MLQAAGCLGKSSVAGGGCEWHRPAGPPAGPVEHLLDRGLAGLGDQFRAA